MMDDERRGEVSGRDAPAGAVEVLRVRFGTCSPFVPREMPGSGRRRQDRHCVATLYRPAGMTAPRPAVVVAHGLGGPTPEREHRYGAWLAERGHVALVTDSFGSRGVGASGELWRALRVTTAMMLADAYAALGYLRTRSDVRGDAVSIIGFSYGGMVSVLCSYAQMRDLFAQAADHAFAGHASYYGCSIPRLEQGRTTGAPVLMLLGGKDRNVSVERSEAIAVDLRTGGSPVEVHLYPQAYHQWDGADHRKRHISFSLRDCHIRVCADGTLLDEKAGKPFDGFLSRFAFLGRHVSLKGYETLRDEAVLADSDTRLARLLAEVEARPRPAALSAA